MFALKPLRFMVVFGSTIVIGCNSGTTPTTQSGSPAVPTNSTSTAEPASIASTPNVSTATSPGYNPISLSTTLAAPGNDTTSISVEFVEVVSNPRGEFVVLRFTNTTDKTVTGILGSVHAYDQEGNVVRGYGYTDQLFNKKPGESVDLPLLKIRPDGPLAAHRETLDQLTYRYQAMSLTFAP